MSNRSLTVRATVLKQSLFTQNTITRVVRLLSARLYVFTCREFMTFNQATFDTLENVQTF